MAESEIHVDVAGYALGALDPAEQLAFERHLADCPSCRAELAELAPAIRLMHRAAPADAPPAALKSRTLAAIASDAERPRVPADERPSVEPLRPAVAHARSGRRGREPIPRPTVGRSRRGRRRIRLKRRALAGAAVLVAVAAAGLVGLQVGEQRQSGTLEVDTRLTSPAGGAAAATVRVTQTGIGRVVAIESETLRNLDNDREFYELWFVGAGDTRRKPNRVSAGTFHPDEQGRTAVRLAAAVVPSDYPVLSLTREPRDGDPRRTGPEVVRSPRDE